MASTPRLARPLAAVIAFAGLATVIAQTGINLDREPSRLIAFAHMMRFFTLWTNLAGALTLAWMAAGRSASARALLALAAAYVVVALVYHVLLAPTHHPVGLDWWTNLMFHTILPAAALAWWSAFAPRAAWREVPFAMIAPVIYTAFALVVGRTTAFYPYFFLDQPRLGWPAFGGWLAALALFFLAVAAVLQAASGLLRRNRLDSAA